MKALLTLALVVLTTTAAFAADTPAKIAEDYRAKAAAALKSVNTTLESATVPLVAALVKAGDTAGAEELQTQLKAKFAGEPVAKPQGNATALFKSYDTARAKALEPAQKAAVARIDAMLASSEGKKLEVVNELGKVRAEIEAGKVVDVTTSELPKEWSFQRSPTSPSEGKFILNSDGTAIMQGSGNNVGKWKMSKKNDSLSVEWKEPKDTWTVVLGENKGLCEVHSTVWRDTRYIKALTSVP